MKLSDEQIRSIMTKQGLSKTILVDLDQTEITIKRHEQDGWKLVKKSELNGRTKLTFEK